VIFLFFLRWGAKLRQSCRVPNQGAHGCADPSAWLRLFHSGCCPGGSQWCRHLWLVIFGTDDAIAWRSPLRLTWTLFPDTSQQFISTWYTLFLYRLQMRTGAAVAPGHPVGGFRSSRSARCPGHRPREGEARGAPRPLDVCRFSRRVPRSARVKLCCVCANFKATAVLRLMRTRPRYGWAIT
jgi:hypothetical protein